MCLNINEKVCRLWASVFMRFVCVRRRNRFHLSFVGTLLREFAFWSRVNGRGSKIYSKLFSNYFVTSSTQKFTGSCLLEFPVPVFAAFGSYFCLSKTFTFPRTLRRAKHQNLALSIFMFNFFCSGPRIRIIAEDNANAEDAVTYRCNTQVLKQYCLFRAETQWFFCLTIHSLMKRLDRKTLNINING